MPIENLHCPSPSFLLQILLFLRARYRKIKNLLLRHKIDMQIKNLEIKFITKSGQEHFISYFGLNITNKRKQILKINLNGIAINQEKYTNLHGMNLLGHATYLSQEDRSQWPCWEDCNNAVFKAIKDNWRDIVQNNHIFEVGENATVFFPLAISALPRVATAIKKDNLIFLPKNKIIITLEIDNYKYEYALNRLFFYEKCLKFLNCRVKELP